MSSITIERVCICLSVFASLFPSFSHLAKFCFCILFMQLNFFPLLCVCLCSFALSMFSLLFLLIFAWNFVLVSFFSLSFFLLYSTGLLSIKIRISRLDVAKLVTHKTQICSRMREIFSLSIIQFCYFL